MTRLSSHVCAEATNRRIFALALEQLMQSEPSVLAAAMSTLDGFEIAYRSRIEGASPARLAALTSALGSLCAAASKELCLGQVECLVLDATLGRLLLLQVSFEADQYVLSLVASADALLGKIILSARECALQFAQSQSARASTL